jgi:exo-1,4-beta-D-glucosaminidase
MFSFCSRLFLLSLALCVDKSVATKASSSFQGEEFLTRWNLRPVGNDGAGAAARLTPIAPTDVTVPSTVVGGLLGAKAKGFELDPFFGENLQKLYDFSPEFSATPWQYSTVFSVDAAKPQKTLLRLRGVNYRANVYVNGRLVASQKDIVGTFRHYELDVSAFLNEATPDGGGGGGGALVSTNNTLEIRLWQPHDFAFPPGNNSTDLALTFVDWAPHPPDFSMGLFRPVSVVSLPDPFLTMDGFVAQTALDSESNIAQMTFSVVVKNWHDQAATNARLYIDVGLGGPVLIKTVASVPAGEEVRVEFSYKEFKELTIHSPSLWWPYDLGTPQLFQATLGIKVEGGSYALLFRKYGIREMASRLNQYGYRQYYVNGVPILVRAGGWAPDLFLRNHGPGSNNNLRDQFEMVRDMGLNGIRLEGKMESEEFWDLADELGVLTLPGWCCCDAWQHWKDWTEETMHVARESMRTQARRLGGRASVLVFLYSSDELPPENVEKLYLDVFAQEHWPNPTLASASKLTSKITGPTGVKMSGPYSWVPPVYWLQDTHLYGGAYGFLTEGGPGESPMTFASMARTLPKDQLWGVNGSLSEPWSYHCANPVGLFRNLRFFTPPLDARYGPGRSAEDYLYKAQAMTYEGIRSMYEGYSRNRVERNATGVVNWMLNNAWPSNVWHLYDSYLNAGGGYYGAKKANEPLHALMSYTDGTVWIVNSRLEKEPEPVSVRAQVINLQGDVVWQDVGEVPHVPGVTSMPVPTLSVPIDGAGKFGPKETFFVRLTWKGHASPESVNDYWLSPTMDKLDWAKSNFYRTPCSQWADFTALQGLKPVKLDVKWHFEGDEVAVNVGNPHNSGAMAFLLHVRLVDTHRDVDASPVFWTENYFSLRPGESRLVRTTIPATVRKEDISVVVDSWNSVVGAQ